MSDREQVVNYEVAISVLGSMLSLNSRARCDELTKPLPDTEKLIQLEEDHARLWKERQELKLNDQREVERVLRDYGSKVKKELELL